MKTSTALRVRPQSTSFLTNSPSNPPFFTKNHPLKLKQPSSHFPASRCRAKTSASGQREIAAMISETKPRCQIGDGHSRIVVLGAVSVGLVLLGMGMEEHKAMALGPGGPLMEDFWDNVRRYALYALTVSTGALYTILQPIGELLKNPISAILLLLIFGGSFYIVSQVLNAMLTHAEEEDEVQEIRPQGQKAAKAAATRGGRKGKNGGSSSSDGVDIDTLSSTINQRTEGMKRIGLLQLEVTRKQSNTATIQERSRALDIEANAWRRYNSLQEMDRSIFTTREQDQWEKQIRMLEAKLGML